ncbi:DUF6708 domain-containing protein [Variovorax sp. YR752]|uniref:DUF6708 domain-containing protein n=1 Tax=Variovorax sp. YR752 TaxID=1884383 RepID=UPI0031380357
MFNAEIGYARQQRQSAENGRKELNLNGQRSWKVDEASDAEGIDIPGRCVFAQNDAYLELCNPGWDMQWRTTLGTLIVVPFASLIIWMWYGFAVHPLVFNRLIMFWRSFPFDIGEGDGVVLWAGWLVGFPLAAGVTFLLYGWFFGMGARTNYFTYARGRVRFNRLTRKVYVLRPSYCGGNKVFDWDRLVALPSRVPNGHAMASEIIGSLALYQAPLKPDGSDEDAIYVGPSLTLDPAAQALRLWEYIRLYMQEGPTLDKIPANAPAHYRKIPRYVSHAYGTYCGLPSMSQYQLEQGPDFTRVLMHMVSQMTCSWARFPKEWHSDSGLGEPEDRPVQTGAVMTALVYRAQGRLSKEDEIEFLEHYGTAEALAEAQVRQTR